MKPLEAHIFSSIFCSTDDNQSLIASRIFPYKRCLWACPITVIKLFSGLHNYSMLDASCFAVFISFTWDAATDHLEGWQQVRQPNFICVENVALWTECNFLSCRLCKMVAISAKKDAPCVWWYRSSLCAWNFKIHTFENPTLICLDGDTILFAFTWRWVPSSHFFTPPTQTPLEFVYQCNRIVPS